MPTIVVFHMWDNRFQIITHAPFTKRMGHFMVTQTWRVTQTVMCVVTDPQLKDVMRCSRPPRLFLSHTIGCVCGLELRSWLTEAQALNGFVSYFDPLTKYCLATQALIEPCFQNRDCHNLHCQHFRLSGTIIEWVEPARGPSPSNSKCKQNGSTCIQSPHWTLFYKSLASLIITQSKKPVKSICRASVAL